MLKRMLSSRQAMSAVGWLIAGYVRLIYRTSRVIREPADTSDTLFASHPLICTTWHGQFLLTPLIKPTEREIDVSIMIARHKDAEVVAQVIQRFGMHPLRGAGAGDRKTDRGGATALRAALRVLKNNGSVMLTAEVPPGPARQAGLGLVTTARLSGRPIVPCATVAGRFFALNNWSRFTVGLPFSKLAIVVGEPIWVDRDADPEMLETKRREVTRALDAVTDRAYELSGGDPERARPGVRNVRSRPGLILKTYRALSYLGERAAPRFLSRRVRHGKEDAGRLAERFGEASLERPEGPLVWLHAASVGETNAILPMISELNRDRPDISFLVTTGTVTSAKLARARLPERVLHQYMPIDGPKFTERFLDHWKPSMAVLTESEIWPNLLMATDKRKIPVVLVNARMSRRSYRRWKRLPSVAGPLFSKLDLVLAQNATMTRYFSRLGAANVVTSGNLKFDAPPPPADPQALASLQAAVGGRPVFLAASTHNGEDELIVRAHNEVARERPDLLTIIVPRHPERGDAIASLVAGKGLRFARRSSGSAPSPGCKIYIADTIGELGLFFALEPVAFIGGSLVPHGGQNPIEAIKHGAVPLTGPAHDNFADAYKALIDKGGCIEVQNEGELAREVSRLLRSGEVRRHMAARGRSAMDGLSGALPKTLSALEAYLPPREGFKRAS